MLTKIRRTTEGMKARTLNPDTEGAYRNKVCRMQEIINQHPEAFADDYPFERSGDKIVMLDGTLYKWKLPVSCANGEALFTIISVNEGLAKRGRGHSLRTTVFDDEDGDINPGADVATVSAGTMGIYKSALKWFHRWEDSSIGKGKVAFDPALDEMLGILTTAYKRDIGNKRRRGIMKPKEGKDPFSREGYEEMARYMYKLKPNGNNHVWSEIIFANMYYRMQMNSIGRSDNVEDLLFSHFDWAEDAFKIIFITSKGDQGASRLSEWKHMYANSDMPHTCIFLALALYIWSRPHQNPGPQGRLFDGDAQKTRYYKDLLKLIDGIDHAVDLGAPREDLGTHSIRKFADSYAKNIPSGPGEDNVKIRAGHSTGKVNDTYHKADEMSDCFVGRVLSMRPMTDAKFATLPPHFDIAGNDKLGEVGWGTILPDYENYDTRFKRILPFLLASLLFHHKNGNLGQLLPKEHPIFVTTLFATNAPLRQFLEDHILLGVNECPETGMRANGIPPAVVMYINQHEMDRTIHDMGSRITSNTASINSLGETLRSELEQVRKEGPQKTAEYLAQRFIIEGQPITMNSLELVLQQRFDAQDDKAKQRFDAQDDKAQALLVHVQQIAAAGSRAGNSSSSAAASFQSSDRAAQLHTWGGRIHPVPEKYEVPSYPVVHHWNLWHFGDAAQGIGPHKFVSVQLDIVGRNNKTKFCRLKAVMLKLVTICDESFPFTDDRSKTITSTNSDAAFRHAWSTLLVDLYRATTPSPRAYSDLNVNTVYNRLRVKNS